MAPPAGTLRVGRYFLALIAIFAVIYGLVFLARTAAHAQARPRPAGRHPGRLQGEDPERQDAGEVGDERGPPDHGGSRQRLGCRRGRSRDPGDEPDLGVHSRQGRQGHQQARRGGQPELPARRDASGQCHGCQPTPPPTSTATTGASTPAGSTSPATTAPAASSPPTGSTSPASPQANAVRPLDAPTSSRRRRARPASTKTTPAGRVRDAGPVGNRFGASRSSRRATPLKNLGFPASHQRGRVQQAQPGAAAGTAGGHGELRLHGRPA